MTHHVQRWFLLFLGLCLSSASPGSAELPKLMTILPSASSAVSDDALATYFNPAGLGFRKSFNVHYLRTHNGPSSRDDALFLAGWGSSFSMEFSQAGGVPFNRYTLADGFRLTGRHFVGSSYSWYTSEDPEYDRLSLWQIGWLYRRRHLSIGAVVRNVNRPWLRGAHLPRQYDFGIGLRPGTDRVTLTMDARKQEHAKGLELSWSLELRPLQSLFVRGSIREDKRFDIRFGWNLAQLGFSEYHRFDENRHHRDGVVQLSYSALPYTRRPRQRYVIETTLRQIVPALSRAREDPDVLGAILKLDRADFGFGRLQEALDVMRDFRRQGKYLVSYARQYTTGTYMLASHCDRILVHPSGEVRLLGIRAEAMFARPLLDKLGIRVDIEREGKYKSAAEQLTRDTMSEAFREAQNAVLDDLYDQLVQSISEGRRWQPEEVRDRIDHGPYTAWDAQIEGLVDRRVYEDEIKTVARELIGRTFALIKAEDYLERRMYRRRWDDTRPRIAIIRAEGMMVTGESVEDPFTGMRLMGSDTMVRAIRQAREDDQVKAVVLRIDTGGGLVLASDILWHELMLTREKKPLIVSMGDVAASGGYYIATAAHHIIAEPGTITGSIGVFSGKLGLRGFYEKVGLRKTILKRGVHADFYSDYSDYSSEDRAIVQHQVRQMYEDFIGKVADARGMDDEAVDAVAQGRIWTGKQALEHGLLDELGGLPLAIQRAKEQAGLTSSPVDFVVLPEKPWLDRVIDQWIWGRVARVRRSLDALGAFVASPLSIIPYEFHLAE